LSSTLNFSYIDILDINMHVVCNVHKRTFAFNTRTMTGPIRVSCVPCDGDVSMKICLVSIIIDLHSCMFYV
jgi:hypothetical protein